MILSVDTGLNNYGLVVLDAQGAIHHTEVIRTARTKVKKANIAADYASRITAIYTGIQALLDRYPVTALTGELPTFGSQSSTATISLTAGATIMLGISALCRLPLVHASPEEIKEAFTGDPEASKEAIMAQACALYDWPVSYKKVRQKGKPDRHDPVYHVRGERLGKGYFEHIADAIAAFHTCKDRL